MVDATFRPVDSMRIAFTLVLVLTIAPAAAQSVTVNSMGVTSDGQVLIDPGTGQARQLPPLLQPWQFGGVKLHPPHKRTASPTETASNATVPDTTPTLRKHRSPKPAETATADVPSNVTAAEATPAPRKHRAAKPAADAVATAEPPAQKPRRTASVTPPPAAAQPQSGGFSGFGDLDTLTTIPKPAEASKPAPKPVAQPKPVAPPKPVPQPKVAEQPKPTPPIEMAKPAPVAKPVQKASLEPAKPHISAGKAQDSIAFAPNASDPSGTAVGSVRTLATSLANALGDSNARIQLMAYAGQRGEKTSDTRRLSLKRALVVRQLLIDDGIPSERIDVFALGGVDDNGPLDRVDVLIKG